MNATAQMVTTTQVGCGKDRRKKPNSDQDIALEAEDLLKRLRNHIMAMAPHQKDRQQGKLLIEAESILAAITKTREQRLAKLGNDAINAALAAEREWYEGALVEANEYMNQQLAAEREKGNHWCDMHTIATKEIRQLREQLAAAQATIAETSDILSLQFNAGKGRTLEEVSSRNQRAIVRLRQTDTTALTDEREESELEIEKYRLLLKKIEPFAKAWAMEEICDEIEDLIKTRPPKNP